MISNFDPPDDALWTLTGAAQITDAYGALSQPNALYLFARLVTGPGGAISVLTRSTAARSFAVVPGVVYTIRPSANGSAAGKKIKLTLSVTDGATSADVQLDWSGIGVGWEQWGGLQFVPTGGIIEISLSAGPPDVGFEEVDFDGYWLVDELQILSPTEALIMASKLAAMTALRDALAAIDGTGGYRLNLRGGVHRSLIQPDDDHVQIVYPYGCVVEDDETITAIEDTALEAQWDVEVLFYLEETWADRFNSSAIVEADKLSDDIKRLALSDPTLGGEVNEMHLLGFSPGTAGTIPDAVFAECSARFRLKQYVDLSTL